MSGERLCLMLTRHSSVPSRVLGSPKWAHTGFTAISDRAGCATKCGRGCFFKKKNVPPTIAAVCVRVCVSKLPLLQRLSPDSLNAMAFRTPPPFLQSHVRTKRGSCRHPSLLHVPESVSLQQGSKFLCD